MDHAAHIIDARLFAPGAFNTLPLTVKLADGRSYDAEVVGSDPMTDLALLKVEAPGALPTVGFGTSAAVHILDKA